MVSSTLVIATTAPNATMLAPQLMPAPSSSAAASGASDSWSAAASSEPTAAIDTRM
jgi:hypothetical protein